jgi:hypothetical protein
MFSETTGDRLIPFRPFCATLGIGPRSGSRREKDDPEFPRPVRINNRKYIREAEGERYRRVLVQRGLSSAPRQFPCRKTAP